MSETIQAVLEKYPLLWKTSNNLSFGGDVLEGRPGSQLYIESVYVTISYSAAVDCSGFAFFGISAGETVYWYFLTPPGVITARNYHIPMGILLDAGQKLDSGLIAPAEVPDIIRLTVKFREIPAGVLRSV
jgi:hypothetical protein